MTQREITHPPNTFAACQICQGHPRHVFDRRAAHAGGGHMLDCSPCGNRTAKHPTLEAANGDWRRRNGLAPVETARPRLHRVGGGQ